MFVGVETLDEVVDEEVTRLELELELVTRCGLGCGGGVSVAAAAAPAVGCVVVTSSIVLGGSSSPMALSNDCVVEDILALSV